MSRYSGIYRRADDLERHENLQCGKFRVRLQNGSVRTVFEQPSAHTDLLTGWKFHLSVAGEDIPRATEMVAEIYERFDATAFKVVTYYGALTHAVRGSVWSG